MTKACLLASALCLITATASAASGTQYTYTDITIPGSLQLSPVGINKSGTVLGAWYDQSFTEHGFIFKDGMVTSFDYPNDVETIPYGINAAGEIVGGYLDSSYTEHGFTLTISSTGVQKFTSVDYAGSPSFTFTGIDQKGLLFGDAAGDDNAQLLVSYAKKSFTTVLSVNDPALYSVSESGNLSGAYFVYAPGAFIPTLEAYVYSAGVATPIPLPNAANSVAYSVNNSGNAVGYAADSNNVSTGFIYANGSVTAVTAPGAASTILTGINNAGSIVGVAYDTNYNETSYTYIKGKYNPISVPGGSNTGAFAINDPGQIIGTYYDANGQEVFLATPIKK
jgi:uncharacterized membrane protein